MQSGTGEIYFLQNTVKKIKMRCNYGVENEYIFDSTIQ